MMRTPERGSGFGGVVIAVDRFRILWAGGGDLSSKFLRFQARTAHQGCFYSAAIFGSFALALGLSPGSPPCLRTRVQIARGSIDASDSPPSTASAAATPADCPIDMHGGISRLSFCALSVAE